MPVQAAPLTCIRRLWPALLAGVCLAVAGNPAGAQTHSAPAPTTHLRVASWNLGWHMDHALSARWRQACGQDFSLQDGLWRPAPTGTTNTTPGWQLPWGRNAAVQWDIGTLPPCDLFQAPRPAGTPGAPPEREVLAVSAEAYEARRRGLAEVLQQRLAVDVVALQEVSGAQAVQELLGPGYRVCSYEGHKVQRLAIAWRASLGEGRCEAHWPLSLPDKPLKDQVRPGLSVTLQTAAGPLRVATLHLKSSCVSPLDERREEGRGQLDGSDPHCQSLQAQTAPLRGWVQALQADGTPLLLLGDFNRHLGHEDQEAADAPVRVGDKVRNLWRHLNADARLRLLGTQCEGEAGALCQLGAQQVLPRQSYGRLRGGLGCRNPIGLDHIVASATLTTGPAQKFALGRAGESRAGSAEGPAQLGLSDHCPVHTDVQWPAR